ncbi:glycosyltransferase [Tissierella praeacuta]|uniref:glycosyltransferase n=1 Tax=Tissierella praeacuta TaxID=43131 RepID=UPI0028AF111A|nr:glycosyltransferase [Tissierella praeacuta]
MDLIQYKYNPESYKNYFLLYDDMKDFYYKLEMYKKNPTELMKISLKGALQTLHFSIKHRAVEGYISDDERDEMWDYFWGLVYDD